MKKFKYKYLNFENITESNATTLIKSKGDILVENNIIMIILLPEQREYNNYLTHQEVEMQVLQLKNINKNLNKIIDIIKSPREQKIFTYFTYFNLFIGCKYFLSYLNIYNIIKFLKQNKKLIYFNKIKTSSTKDNKTSVIYKGLGANHFLNIKMKHITGEQLGTTNSFFSVNNIHSVTNKLFVQNAGNTYNFTTERTSDPIYFKSNITGLVVKKLNNQNNTNINTKIGSQCGLFLSAISYSDYVNSNTSSHNISIFESYLFDDDKKTTTYNTPKGKSQEDSFKYYKNLNRLIGLTAAGNTGRMGGMTGDPIHSTLEKLHPYDTQEEDLFNSLFNKYSLLNSDKTQHMLRYIFLILSEHWGMEYPEYMSIPIRFQKIRPETHEIYETKQGGRYNTVINSTDELKQRYSNGIIALGIEYDNVPIILGVTGGPNNGCKRTLYGTMSLTLDPSFSGKFDVGYIKFKIAIEETCRGLLYNLDKYGPQIILMARISGGIYAKRYHLSLQSYFLNIVKDAAQSVKLSNIKIIDIGTRIKYSKINYINCCIFVKNNKGIVSCLLQPNKSNKSKREFPNKQKTDIDIDKIKTQDEFVTAVRTQFTHVVEDTYQLISIPAVQISKDKYNLKYNLYFIFKTQEQNINPKSVDLFKPLHLITEDLLSAPRQEKLFIFEIANNLFN